jgi:hypothetical protein
MHRATLTLQVCLTAVKRNWNHKREDTWHHCRGKEAFSAMYAYVGMGASRVIELQGASSAKHAVERQQFFVKNCCPGHTSQTHGLPSATTRVPTGTTFKTVMDYDVSDILGGGTLPVGRNHPPSFWSTIPDFAKTSLYIVCGLVSLLFLRDVYHRFLRWRELGYRKYAIFSLCYYCPIHNRSCQSYQKATRYSR